MPDVILVKVSKFNFQTHFSPCSFSRCFLGIQKNIQATNVMGWATNLTQGVKHHAEQIYRAKIEPFLSTPCPSWNHQFIRGLDLGAQTKTKSKCLSVILLPHPFHFQDEPNPSIFVIWILFGMTHVIFAFAPAG